MFAVIEFWSLVLEKVSLPCIFQKFKHLLLPNCVLHALKCP